MAFFVSLVDSAQRLKLGGADDSEHEEKPFIQSWEFPPVLGVEIIGVALQDELNLAGEHVEGGVWDGEDAEVAVGQGGEMEDCEEGGAGAGVVFEREHVE